MKRRSLTQILFSWSVLMLGIITVSLGYLLLQLQLSQFSNHWEQRISFENEALKHDIEFHLNNGATAMVEAHINRMSQDPSLVYMAIISANAEQVYFSTRRTDLLRGLDYRLSSYSLNTGIRKPQIQRHRSEFYALYPIDMPGRSNQSTNGWLFAHYDAATDYEQMLRSVVRKIALIAALAIAYLAIQTQIIRRHIFGPVRRLIVLTEALREGRYVTVRQDESTDEIGRLEDAFNDLSEHLEATTASIDQHQALTDAFTTAFPDVGLTVSSTGVISGRFGYPKSRISRLNEDLIGTPFTAWLNLAATDIIEKARDRALKNNELVIADFSHDDLFLESRMIPMGDGNKAEFQLMWLIRDISEVKRKQQLIEYQANYDPLTELANRRMALLELEKYITRAKANGSWGAVLFIDLDHFKNINDSLGHPIGDRLLVEAARRLSHTASDKDVIARLGGDEFLIIMDTEYQDEADAENQALALGNQLLEAIRLPFSIDINKFHLTASIGIAVFPVSECGANDLIRQADTAMYWAKHQGRSRICLYNHRMQEETRERLHLFNDLYQAIRDNGFTLVYQPQHNDRGEVTGAEALCRWVNNGRSVYPDVFIAAAEETNLILPLGDWILNNACRTLRDWVRGGKLPESFKRLAVNISPAQFMAPDFEDKLQKALAAAEIDSSIFEIELTESLFMGDKDLIREKMQRLSSQGFTFALDDFGTGYSSLSYLQKLPINKLKIDRAFVMDIMPEHAQASIVDAIIQLGSNLNMDIIAEGVETDFQRDYLNDHGCHNYQGYYFSRPLREDMFLQYLQDPSTDPENPSQVSQ